MTFILTNREKLTPTKKDYEHLREALQEVVDEINFSWLGFVYDTRVSYYVGPDYRNLKVHVNEGLEIGISFRKKDLDKHPTKYGLNFRNDCLKTALRLANEIINKDRKFLTITIREDGEPVEECRYERRNAVGNP